MAVQVYVIGETGILEELDMKVNSPFSKALTLRNTSQLPVPAAFRRSGQPVGLPMHQRAASVAAPASRHSALACASLDVLLQAMLPAHGL